MISKAMIAVIQFYRKYLSPLKHTKCPYIPTCSEYGSRPVAHPALQPVFPRRI